MSRTRGYCLTINNYTEIEYENIIKKLDEEYEKNSVVHYVVGREVGQSGTPHLQMFLYYKNARTFTAMKKQYKTAHIEEMKGTPKEASDYCKEDGDFVTKGDCPDHKSVNLWNEIKDTIKQGIAWKDLIDKYPEYAVKYLTGLRNFYNELSPPFVYTLPENVRPFQQKLLDLSNEEPHDRQVFWLYDKMGNSGKTKLALHLASHNDFLILENGKTADVAHSWNGENVIFDFSRTQRSHINYQVIESIKNGKIFSSKYNSSVKIHKPPHVWIFANFLPDYSALSMDRWVVAEMRKDFDFNLLETSICLEEKYEQQSVLSEDQGN